MMLLVLSIYIRLVDFFIMIIAPHQRSQSKESLPQRVTQNQVLLDIQVATSYVQMLQEALAYVDPEKDDINSNELVQEFYGKCREIEPRINNAILNISDELLLAQLLKTNSDMTNAFKMRDDIIEATALNYAKKISQTVSAIQKKGVSYLFLF